MAKLPMPPPMSGKPKIGVAIAIQKPKGQTPPPMAGDEPDEDDRGGADDGIPPEAVDYRTEDQTCQYCAYMGSDGQCSKLHIPVSEGDSCRLFKAGHQEPDADERGGPPDNDADDMPRGGYK